MATPIIPKERCYIPSREITRQRYLQRQNLRNKTGKKLHEIPDNSVPWGPPPQSVAEALAISDEITRQSEALRSNLLSE